MTALEPPPEQSPDDAALPRRSPPPSVDDSASAEDTDVAYNLAARVFSEDETGDAHPAGDGNGDGADAFDSRIERRVVVAPEDTREPASTRQPGPRVADYNLAARIDAPLPQSLKVRVAPKAPAASSESAVVDTAELATTTAVGADTGGTGRRWHLPRTFEALEFGPFRWYMGAMIWWNAAMSMQMLARGYLAFQLTGDFRALGIVGLGSGIPMLILSPLGGVIADRTSRRFVLQIGQVSSLGIAVVVAVLLFSGRLEFWHLIGSSVAQGVMMALVMPSRQSFLPEVVGMQRLMNAIPLQSAGMNLMQLMAPAAAGFMIDWAGAGYVYSTMAVFYGMSVIALFGVKSMTAEELKASRTDLPEMAPARRSVSSEGRKAAGSSGALSELRAGMRYIFRDHTIFAIMSLSFITTVLAMPIRMLLPGYVAAVFGDSGATLGLLQSAMAIGALAGALGLATLRMRHHRGLLFAGSAVLMGLAMMAFSATDVFLLGAVGLFAIGVGSAGRQAMSQILVQEYVEDEYRGRVMAVFMMQFSLMSVGTLVVAIYMQAVGAQFAIGSLGVVLIVATTVYLVLVPTMRRLA